MTWWETPEGYQVTTLFPPAQGNTPWSRWTVRDGCVGWAWERIVGDHWVPTSPQGVTIRAEYLRTGPAKVLMDAVCDWPEDWP